MGNTCGSGVPHGDIDAAGRAMPALVQRIVAGELTHIRPEDLADPGGGGDSDSDNHNHNHNYNHKGDGDGKRTWHEVAAVAEGIARAQEGQLVRVDLSHLGARCGDNGAVLLAEGLSRAQNTALKDLSLVGCELSCAGAGAICGAMVQYHTLDLLSLVLNPLQLDGATHVGTMLRNPAVHLRRLVLDCTELGGAGAAEVAAGLAVNTSLQVLSVGTNELGAEGARVLADALRTNTALTELHVGNNGMGRAGCVALAAGLAANTAVVHVDMSRNEVDDDALEAIVAALVVREKKHRRRNHHDDAAPPSHTMPITHLNLWHNPGMSTIPAKFSRATSLQHFDILDGNSTEFICPPYAVLQQGLDATRAFLADMMMDGDDDDDDVDDDDQHA